MKTTLNLNIAISWPFMWSLSRLYHKIYSLNIYIIIYPSLHNHKPSYIIQHHNINPFITTKARIESCGHASPTCVIHQNTLHYIKTIISNIGRDIDSHGCQDPRKCQINNLVILFIPTTTKSYNCSHTGHTVRICMQVVVFN